MLQVPSSSIMFHMFHHLLGHGDMDQLDQLPKAKVIVITSYQAFHQPFSGATSGNQSHWRGLCAMVDFASVSSCCNSSTWMLFPTWTSAGDNN